jgi:hypothetical protein
MLVGRVVRHLAGGFAIQFVAPQDRDAVENLAITRINRLTRVAR